MSVPTITQPSFIPATLATHRAQIVEMNIEYISWTLDEIERIFGLSAESLLGMSVPRYVDANIAKVCEKSPPDGVFYLVEHAGTLAGMGGLRRIGDGVAEIKRMYVQPAHRGKGLGEAILKRLLANADEFGYRTQRLDSAPFMHAAHALYQRHGFVDRGPYPEAEPPAVLYTNWRFMERTVNPTRPS